MRIGRTAVVALGLTAVIGASRPALRQAGGTGPATPAGMTERGTPRVSTGPDPAFASAALEFDATRGLEPATRGVVAPFEDATGAGWWKKHELVGEVIGCFATGMAIAAAIISPPGGLILLGIAAATLHCM